MRVARPRSILKWMDSYRFAECVQCGDRIGVYEPIVVIELTGVRTTSIAREPKLHQSALPMFHAACAAAVEARGELAA